MALCELSEPACRFCGPEALATSSLLAVAQGMSILVDSVFPIFRPVSDKIGQNSFMARPGRGTYSASKFAIEAMHESLSYEVKELGIKVLIVEPGAFRTPFASRVLTPTQFEHGFSEGYKDTVLQQMMTAHRSIKSIPDQFKGDPDKAARAILSAIASGIFACRWEQTV
jgi:NAD(P)-dependent dehydrogenase (short-subunit alcohol dehydrogenase family)